MRACESDKGFVGCSFSVMVCIEVFVFNRYPYNPSSLTDLYVIEINIKRFAGGIIYYTPCNRSALS